MTLESLEIYILTHYVYGKTACIAVLEAIARLLGHQPEIS